MFKPTPEMKKEEEEFDAEMERELEEFKKTEDYFDDKKYKDFQKKRDEKFDKFLAGQMEKDLAPFKQITETASKITDNLQIASAYIERIGGNKSLH